MNKTNFFIEKTKSSLKYLGIVAVIISLSVMFSSLCIMSLVSLSDSIMEGIIEEPKSKVGGEVRIDTDISRVSVLEEKLIQMQNEEIIDEYTSLAKISEQYVLYSEKGYEKEYLSIVGYRDKGYPLDGVMQLDPQGKDMQALLNDKEGVVLSHKLADREDIKIGDTVTFVSTDLYKKLELKVIGLINEDYKGSISSVYVNIEKLAETSGIYGYTFYIDGNQEKIKEELGEEWEVLTIDDYIENEKEENGTYITFIRSLSILGLFIGSFGIANSIKVIITRRKKEIGILKTVGFKEKDITSMFLLEVFVISVVGTILGILLGHLFFQYLANILSVEGVFVMIVGTEFDMSAAIISFVASMVSSLLFAYISIKEISKIKPIYAIKDLDHISTNKEKGKNVPRFLLIGIIFCGISIFLAESVEFGIGAVILSAVIMLIFSFIFRLIFLLLLKIKVKTHNEIEFAWGNLKLNYKKIVVPMMAIFIGMFAINLINTLIYSTRKEYDNRYRDVQFNINVVTDRVNPEDNILIERIEQMDNVQSYFPIYKARIIVDTVTQGEKTSSEEPVLIPLQDSVIGANMSELTEFYTITQGEQLSYGVVVPSWIQDSYKYKLNDVVEVKYEGEIIKLPITGFYMNAKDMREYSSIVGVPFSNFVSVEEFDRYFKKSFIEEVWLVMEEEEIEPFLQDISDIPDVFATSSQQYEDLTNRSINLLIKFSTSVASLALLAGIILIITVTVLDVVSRKRDFAIYKVVGFKQKEITKMVLFEYGIMTVITSIFSSLLVYFITIFMNEYGADMLDLDVKIYFDLKGSIYWNIGLLSCIFLLVYLVSRKSLNTKPGEVLRYE
ncbi:ABC transporter permease [Candidatus Dojkabacteria bacterium]|nr:ABC transporter permease [Candidatus Dojkabacteria bacterium]